MRPRQGKDDVRAKKRFGQHFLEPAWAERLVQSIAPQGTDRFLEIGPGPGALTLRLAPQVAHLTAVELDREMAAALRPRLPANVTLVEQDFLDFDVLAVADRDLRVAGNLPYNVSSPILFALLRARRGGARLVDATLMLQREVADRIEGQPGTKNYGTLAIFVQLRASVRRLLTLPPGAFRPIPKVHSAVLHLVFKESVVPLRDEATFERLVNRSSRSAGRRCSMRSSHSQRSAASTPGVPSRRPASTAPAARRRCNLQN